MLKHKWKLFFSEFDLPTISQDQKPKWNEIELNSAAELREAIQLLQTGKAPGSDGLGSKFYKEFQSLLLEPMMNMFNSTPLNVAPFHHH